jgi:hypothetical protein
VGLNNTVLMIPLVVIFHYTGFEPFELPDLYYTCVMSVYGLTSVVCVYSWAKAVVGLGPAFASSTFALITFPITIFLDVAFSEEEK